MTSSLLLSFYGDDFTGSTDVAESLVRAGLRTVLFLEPPTRDRLRSFDGLRAFGVAGTGRTMSPARMNRELPPLFRALRDSGARLVHYKICSTFDSSPQIGSIGRAIELGRRTFRSSFVPLVVGAPVLGRYCVFGNLFARSGLDTEPHRLDRHPTMRQHPTTPMDEADLRLHLARQTKIPIRLVDVLELDSIASATRASQRCGQNGDIVLFDVLHPNHLPVIGRLLWCQARARRPLFVVGSSGVEYALTAAWRADGDLGPPPPPPKARPARQLLVLSGSCSPVTERQVRAAFDDGFVNRPLDVLGLVSPKTAATTIARTVRETGVHLAAGRSVILHTCLGPNDRRINRVLGRLESLGHTRSGMRGETAGLLGNAMGTLLEQLVVAYPLPRVCVTGGDTSSYVARALGIVALEPVAPVAPGGPLCRIHAPGRPAHGLEIVFKGGQVGRTGFFRTLLRGGDSSLWGSG
jgi:3-oxoisoapionate kinase